LPPHLLRDGLLLGIEGQATTVPLPYCLSVAPGRPYVVAVSIGKVSQAISEGSSRGYWWHSSCYRG
jgi:hypothetical protein